MGFFFNRRNEKATPFEGVPLLKNHYADTPIAPAERSQCDCFDEYYAWEDRFDGAESDEDCEKLQDVPLVWSQSLLHVERRSHSQRAWDIACEIIEAAARKGIRELNLGKIMDRPDFKALNTLPENIGELKDLETLILYGSSMSSIPREISGCENLKSFQPYTSHRLHWLPYEIRRCRNLTDSCISTRALYGNHKMRPPFPDLSATRWKWHTGGEYCSVCGAKTADLDQYWVSQRVATDVVPLLVSVCSRERIERVGRGAPNYVEGLHKGGLDLEQPSADYL